MQASGEEIKIAGILLKRGRERNRLKRHFQTVKFQERYFQLTRTSLKYFESEKDAAAKPKGCFEASRVKMVKTVAPNTFPALPHGYCYCFQVGDGEETLYLATKTEEERATWMKELRKVAENSNAEMVSTHQPGIYDKKQWSCNAAEVEHNPQHAPHGYHSINLASDSASSTPEMVKRKQSSVKTDDIQLEFSNTDTIVCAQNHGHNELEYSTVGKLRPGIVECSPASEDECDQLPDHPTGTSPEQGEYTMFLSRKPLNQKEEVKLGADPNKGYLLHEACKQGNNDRVEVLLSYEADVNLQDKAGNTPLIYACQKGHQHTVELLVEKGAAVDAKGPKGKTPLHEAAEAHCGSIIEFLISKYADTVTRDDSDATPYDLAFKKGYTDVMEVLRDSMPASVRPYTLLHSCTIASSKPVTALSFYGTEVLISGSNDSCVSFWMVPSLSLAKEMKVSSKVLAIDTWSHYVAIGSIVTQVIDLTSQDGRRILIADSVSLKDPPLHLVAFAPSGHLVTASTTSNVVKVWPPPTPDSNVITKPHCVFTTYENGYICSLAMSPSPQRQWLAVAVKSKELPSCSNYLFKWDSKEPHHVLKFGCKLDSSVHTKFSPDGKQITLSCDSSLFIWDTRTGKSTGKVTLDACICSLCYSPNGKHLAAGMANGEVKVFEVQGTISPIFNISGYKQGEAASKVTSIAYSVDGRFFTIGCEGGSLQLWKSLYGTPDAESQETIGDQAPDSDVQGLDNIFRGPTPSDKPQLVRSHTQKFSSQGGECSHWQDYGYQLLIPEGAIVQNNSISVECGVVPYGPLGPFEFPDDLAPISPIVWFCSTPRIEFQKQVSIILEHCAENRSEKDCSSLVVLKADHKCTLDESGGKIYSFKPVENQPHFELHTLRAKVLTTHFCFYCVSIHKRELTNKIAFCLTQAKPICVGTRRYHIHFCLSYHLSTCLKLLNEQYGLEGQLIQRKVTFPKSNRRESFLKIDFKSPSHGSGWRVTRVGPEKVFAKEVCFWDANYDQLWSECLSRTHPPRFILEVTGSPEAKYTVLEVNFKGANEDLSTQVSLDIQRLQEDSAMVQSYQPKHELVVGKNTTVHHVESHPHHGPPPVVQEHNPPLPNGPLPFPHQIEEAPHDQMMQSRNAATVNTGVTVHPQQETVPNGHPPANGYMHMNNN